MKHSDFSFNPKIEVAQNITMLAIWIPMLFMCVHDIVVITNNLKTLYKQSKIKDSNIRYRPDIDEIMLIPDDEESEINEEKNLEVL